MGKKKIREKPIIENMLHNNQNFREEAHNDKEKELAEVNEAIESWKAKQLLHKILEEAFTQRTANSTAHFS